MFDDLLRQIAKIPSEQVISISLQLDDDGFFDRRCPAAECGAAFKVLFEDWKSKVPDEFAWCAICGERSDPQDFNTPEQAEYIKAQALAHITGQLDTAMRSARKPTVRSGFLSMTWSYKPGTRPLVVPAEAEPVMTQRSTCEACGCRYASIGAAFFCPACGHNSAKSMFAGALTTVRGTMDLADRMGAIVDDRDVAADTARHLGENSLVRVWASFQRLAEAAYAANAASSTKPARRNAFQNLGESDRLWKGAIGRTYADMLSADEHADLVRLVQGRHVLSHKDGIVDADYVSNSGDARYAVGQRLVVTAADVRRLADITEKLAANLV